MGKVGFKFESTTIKCPLYRNVVRTNKGQFQGVECAKEEHLGFDATHIIRLRNREELRDYLEIFCEDMYESCPIYQYYTRKWRD